MNKTIDNISECCLVAELSANHNGDIERAEMLIRAAAGAGANAIKLQTYTADSLTIPCDNEFFRIKGTLWAGSTLYELYNQAHTPWEWTPRLKQAAESLGMFCFSTPFDEKAVEFLETIDMPCYKIASFELVDHALLKKVAATGKPVIMSTGMANLAEIDEAVRVLRANGAGELTLLKCTSAYPAPPEEANLRTIPNMAQTFNCKTGLSDHTMGHAVAIAAVSLGACMIEKHFTLNRADGGPDAAFSMEPAEFAEMSSSIRTVEKALGKVSYDMTAKQQESRVFRRSLFAVADIAQGETLTCANIRSIRPGYGLPPKNLDIVLGKKAAMDIARGTPLTWEMIG